MKKDFGVLVALAVTLAIFAFLFHHHGKSIRHNPYHRTRTPVALSKTTFSRATSERRPSLIIIPPSGQDVVNEIVRHGRVEAIHLKGWLITFAYLNKGTGLPGDPLTWEGDAWRNGHVQYHYFVSATRSLPRPGYDIHSTNPIFVSSR